MMDLMARLGKVEQDLLDISTALAHNYIELIQAENVFEEAEGGSREERLANFKREQILFERNWLQSDRHATVLRKANASVR